MKRKLFMVSAVLVMAFSSCSKWSEDWTGTYDSTTSSNYSRVVVAEVNKKTIKIELQTTFLGSYVTSATIANGKLSSAKAVTIDEDGTVAGTTGTWHFTGSGTLDGNRLVLAGVATQQGQSDINYAFNGTK